MTEEIKQLIVRVEALEKAVFENKKILKPTKDYSGPNGGVRTLIEQDLFKTKKTLADVRMELEKRGYHYSRQAVHNALKTLSNPGGPLVALKEQGNKVYVERK